MRKTLVWALMVFLALSISAFAAPADISVTSPATTIANNSSGTNSASAATSNFVSSAANAGSATELNSSIYMADTNTGVLTAVATMVNGKPQVKYVTSMPIAATNPCVANTLNVSIAVKDSRTVVPVTDAKATNLDLIAGTYDSPANAAATTFSTVSIGSATGNFAERHQLSASPTAAATYAYLILGMPNQNEPRFPFVT